MKDKNGRFAAGGYIAGPVPPVSDEYPHERGNNPEVVVPLTKLREMIATTYPPYTSIKFRKIHWVPTLREWELQQDIERHCKLMRQLLYSGFRVSQDIQDAINADLAQ